MLKRYKPIIIVAGEPESTFLEIFIKTAKHKNFKSPLILICSLNLLDEEIKRLRLKKKIKILDVKELNNCKLNNSCTRTSRARASMQFISATSMRRGEQDGGGGSDGGMAGRSDTRTTSEPDPEDERRRA